VSVQHIGYISKALLPLKEYQDPPLCVPCNSLLPVEHILINCVNFDIIRQNFCRPTASNLKDLFHNMEYYIHPK